MSNKIVSIARQSSRLICIWVPTGNPRMPLTCVWLQDQHYPAGAGFQLHLEHRVLSGKQDSSDPAMPAFIAH